MRFSTFLVLALLLWPALSGAAVTASLDRQQLYEGDRLTLTIEASGQSHSGEPELTPLEQDFTLLGTSRGTQISIINGRTRRSQQWRITLAPKRLGDLEIPPLTVGDDTTPALRVRVAEAPEGALGSPGDDVFIELTLERPDDEAADAPVLVQQQLPLVVRLYSALPLRGGALSDPRPEGAVLERLGPDQRYSSTRNGRDYQVIERRYSLSPERSGELRIPPVVFEGELSPGRGVAQDNRAPLDRMFEDFPFAGDLATSPLALFESGEPVRAQSRALTLEVSARPEDFSAGHWLPAEALAVTDAWAEQPPALRVGEPATRTLTLTAKGLAGSQIPDVERPAPANARTYREPSEHETRTDGQVVYAISRQSITLIPTQAGRLELPELRIRWWDVQAGRERETRVPALSLEVAPSVGATAAAPAPASPPVAATSPQPRETETHTADNRLGWLLGAMLALLALAAAGVLTLMALRQRRPLAGWGARTTTSPPPPSPSVSPSRPREAVRQAALSNDPGRTAETLLVLGRVQWPEDPPLNLGQLAQRLSAVSAEAGTALRELEAVLYAPDPGAWAGALFWERVGSTLDAPARATPRPDRTLPPLYPPRQPSGQ
jgi:hypothetical protein